MSFLDAPISPSDDDVQEFRTMIKEKYKVEYSDTEAREGAYNLLNFIRVLLKIDKDLFVGRKRLIKVLKKVSSSHAN